MFNLLVWLKIVSIWSFYSKVFVSQLECFGVYYDWIYLNRFKLFGLIFVISFSLTNSFMFFTKNSANSMLRKHLISAWLGWNGFWIFNRCEEFVSQFIKFLTPFPHLRVLKSVFARNNYNKKPLNSWCLRVCLGSETEIWTRDLRVMNPAL